jgi:hypothetical protein
MRTEAASASEPPDCESRSSTGFKNGNIQIERGYFDLAGLMQQVGIAPTKS